MAKLFRVASSSIRRRLRGAGGGSGGNSLDFSNENNSMYIPLL